jgi:hypothetical protein
VNVAAVRKATVANLEDRRRGNKFMECSRRRAIRAE